MTDDVEQTVNLSVCDYAEHNRVSLYTVGVYVAPRKLANSKVVLAFVCEVLQIAVFAADNLRIAESITVVKELFSVLCLPILVEAVVQAIIEASHCAY